MCLGISRVVINIINSMNNVILSMKRVQVKLIMDRSGPSYNTNLNISRSNAKRLSETSNEIFLFLKVSCTDGSRRIQ